ncbi:hypothetical protein [Desulfogranum marinum]|uniref:hypothetical protein n=1 Tax=Desulfogranum marinum TaxID=453220 RepID=UPI0019658596|nr:hypothetical protein [Desulfogranum marinum]MBM9513012.1 hypothetical protein [Desulfogranum marinum]
MMKRDLPIKAKIPIVVLFFLALWALFHPGSHDQHTKMTISAGTESSDALQVFWATTKHSYVPEKSSIAPLHPGNHEYHLQLAVNGRLRKLRVDPATQKDFDITIYRVQVAADGEVFVDISGDELFDMASLKHQISIVPDASEQNSVLSTTGIDPYFELDIETEVRSHWWKIEMKNCLAALGATLLFWCFLHLLTGKRYLSCSHDTYPYKIGQWWIWGGVVLVTGLFFTLVLPVVPGNQWVILHWIAVAYVIGAVLFVPLFWLVTRPLHRVAGVNPGRYAWLWFALPCVVVWSMYLLAFWPGSMSPDSLDQWKQVLNGRWKDWHPAFHTMTLWLITRVYLSPALVAVVQIFTLASTVGWALSVLGKYGINRRVLWVAAFLCALWPVNGFMVVILWKDLAYSVVLLILSIYIFQIVLERGKWLCSVRNLFLLGLVLLLVSLYRHNGIVPALLTPLMLVAFYPRHWRRVIAVLVLTILCHGLIKGPLYSSLDVRMGGPVAKVIQALRNDFLQGKDKGASEKPQVIIGSRSEKPNPDHGKNWFTTEIIERIYSASALWRVMPMNFFHKRIEQINLWQEGYGEGAQVRYVCGNPYNIKERPLWPQATPWLYKAFNQSLHNPWLFWMWRPAVYLYALVALSLVVSFRIRKRMYLVLFPALVNSLPLFLIVIHKSIFRYHYPIVLLGIVLFLPLLFFQDIEVKPNVPKTIG